MKQVKIMLTAITVFAVVGGALAFKAKKSPFVIYTTTTPGANALCPNRTPDFTTTTSGGGGTLTSATTIAPVNGVGAACDALYTIAE